ncbi:unnamed protein product [Rhizophagus irregularis]|uniref:C2H2-type domain-containing protein n=2 Tax=Rhizophagus irregularis TaxID=588596 RepID=A0A916E568_9GLOM|nr:unnamed protein product [Rhizophagus irregularis]CAB4468197.1 unnamed protein product [Rhizophagus irregularis]CAB5211467.1 unnamed protein product [Rhizophagus irregularis]CAB5360571.1 unnamed protein product [Rhizophagus irregularis]CAB5362848.1 unnamed protein product [Rhizophagus irregularis]
MTAIAGNNYLITMPYIGQYDINLGGNGYDYPPQFVKTEYFPTQKQQPQQQPPQQPQQPQEQLYYPMSGSTSPQHPNLLYSHQLEQYDNNNDNTKNVQVKTEFDYRQFEESVSSVESSPHNVPVNDFEQPSQFTYNYPPPLCDDSSSEPISTATSPTVTTGGDLTFALSPDSLSQYYSIIQSTPLDQNTGVQPSFTDQMRFIIYEPRQNDNVSLLPNINGQNFSSVPMWSLPVSAPSIDNRPITSVASTQASQSQTTQQSTTQQGQQTQQQQQQLIKCPHDDCPKTFSRLYNLKAHLRSHSPARPYQCPMCPRSFSRKHDLQRHIRVHTGVKPYQCPCCRKAFARTDALRRHFKMEETCRNSPEVQNMKTRRRYSEMH